MESLTVKAHNEMLNMSRVIDSRLRNISSNEDGRGELRNLVEVRNAAKVILDHAEAVVGPRR